MGREAARGKVRLREGTKVRYGKLLSVTMFLLVASVAARADVVGYIFDVTTNYQFGCASGITAGHGDCGSPDTGFLTLQNNGTTTFTGTITFSGTAGNGQVINLADSAGLGLGAQVVFGAGPESSNTGGWNKAGGSNPDNGLMLEINGTVTDGSGIEAIDLIVFDKDIHSGVPRTNPFGVVLDNYVLQGGDPFGRDTGDDYETTQANGHFQFAERISTGPVPEPGSIILLGTTLSMLGLAAWRRKRTL